MINSKFKILGHHAQLIPEGWKRNSLPKIKYLHDSNSPQESIVHKQKQRWTRTTGVTPENSHITIVVPIRNGGKYFAPMLHTLVLADIPRSTHTTFLFITNDCTDKGKSKRVVMSLLQTIGLVEKGLVKKVFPMLDDPGIDNTYHRVKIDNTNFIHIDTSTPGKANALNQGNAIANVRNAVAICADANTFVEPDAIARIYKKARIEFYNSPQSKTQLIMGEQKYDPLPKPHLPKKLQNIPSLSHLSLKELLPVLANKSNTIPLNGSFMAWNPSYIKKIGGFPNVANEDGALVFNLRENNKKSIIAKGAVSWEIRPQTLKDRERTLSRLVRGWLQTIKAYPEYEKDIRKLIPNMKDPETGITYKDLIKWQKDRPNVPKEALPYIFELSKRSYQKGKKEYEAKPKVISW